MLRSHNISTQYPNTIHHHAKFIFLWNNSWHDLMGINVLSLKLQVWPLTFTALPRHPLALSTAKNIYFDEKWKAKQERGFTVWMNFYLAPPQGTIPPQYQNTRDIVKNAARKARKSGELLEIMKLQNFICLNVVLAILKYQLGRIMKWNTPLHSSGFLNIPLDSFHWL